uniref:Complement factor D n=1 Tax=Colobus angolensis palliatus TaxID=336983 RepID=A0A2K5I6U5_COLAP
MHSWEHLAVLVLLGAAACGEGAWAWGEGQGSVGAWQWVLSAAHCLEDAADGKVQVLLGAHSLSQPEPSKRRYDVLRAVPHPDSRPDTIDHDLLLLQLSEKATLGPAVRPLPWQRVDRDVNPGTLCDVAGWGIVSHAGRRPDRLQHVLLPVLDRATCNRRTHHDGAITERMMCAESNRRDSCKVSLQRNGRAWEETRDPHDGAWTPAQSHGAWLHKPPWVRPDPQQEDAQRRLLGAPDLRLPFSARPGRTPEALCPFSHLEEGPARCYRRKRD